MWSPRRWFDRDALSRYWNALVYGAPDDVLAPLAAALDDEQLAVIARLRNRQPNQPDPAFVARLERELVRDLAIAGASSVPLRAVARPAVNGGVPPRSFGLPSFGSPRRWSLTPVVTALLVITLLAGYLVFIRPQGTTGHRSHRGPGSDASHARSRDPRSSLLADGTPAAG